jgi:hypothetical protein
VEVRNVSEVRYRLKEDGAKSVGMCARENLRGESSSVFKRLRENSKQNDDEDSLAFVCKRINKIKSYASDK